ncbi:MAG TPA: sulfotransferase, partial [Tepidisphaeraceae bacterium]|nr:sulfotransferase [Tepidisphaeraceae bacterium]
MIDQDGHNLAFILGLPRSGTTLLSVMLDRHPQVLCPPEPWIMLALESVGKVCVQHPADSHLIGQAISEFVDPQGSAKAAAAYAASVYNQKLASAGKTLFVDK